MKIPRRKKLDRTAFFFMSAVRYLHYRLSINKERRLDRRLPPIVLIERDRKRAARFRQDFKEGPGVPVEQLFISKPDEMPPHES